MKLLKLLTLFIKGFCQRIIIIGCREDFLTMKVSDYLHPKPYLGFSFEEIMRELRTGKQISIDVETFIRNRCIDFLVNLITQLQQQLPDNVQILKKLSLLVPENCLRTKKSTIAPLAQLMKENPDVINEIEFQWSWISFIQ